MNWLIEKIESFKDKRAIIWDENVYTYSDLYKEISRYSEEIVKTIEPGKTVAILSDYSYRAIAVFLALVENKNIIVPIINSIEEEINDRLESSGIETIITFKDTEIEINHIECKAEEHKLVSSLKESKCTGLILFSSGSTGKPKAMIHNLDALIDTFKGKKEKRLNFLIFLMFDHIGGLNTLFNAISMGITITLPVSRDAFYICSIIEKYKVDILPTSPSFLNLMLISEAYKQFDITCLKMITYGTEPMPESLLIKLKEILPSVRFLQTFGTSETGIAAISSKSSTSTLIKINDPNLEYKIIDNELWLKSKTQILGYLNASMERFTDDGWFKTGDLIERAEGGYLKIIGRNSEIINVGGQKVLPAEVESCLLQMPNIFDCMVYSEPNAILGQIVVADVNYNGDISNKELRKAVKAFCKDKLDYYKCPVKVKLVDNTNINDRFKKIRRK